MCKFNKNILFPDKFFKSLIRELKLSSCLIALFSSALLAFGLYNIHSLSGVTEGGILGLTLLLEYWYEISPSRSGMILNLICYLLGWKFLGKKFIVYSFIASTGFSCSYKICEHIGPLFPQLIDMPLLSAVLGALFVGISVGLCVRIGGAPSGDDALAMSLSQIFRMNIKWAYLLCDLAVLILSLSYIPARRIAYSLLTVLLSGQIIGLMQKKQHCV